MKIEKFEKESILDKEVNVTMTVKEMLALAMFLGEFSTADYFHTLQDAQNDYDIEGVPLSELSNLLGNNNLYSSIRDFLKEIGIK